MISKEASGNHNLEKMEKNLINYLLLVGSVLGALAFLSSLTTDPAGPTVWVIQLLAVLSAFGLFFARHLLSTKLKVNAILIILLVAVVNGLVENGPRASEGLLVVLVALISLVIYDRNQSMAIYVGTVLVYLALGFFGRFFIDKLAESALGAWVAHALLLLMIGLLIQLYISTYIKSLQGLLDDANSHLRALTASRKELEKTKSLLEKAIAHSPSGIMIADADSVKLSMANEAAFFIHGGEAEILTGIDPVAYTKEWEVLHLDGTAYSPTELPLYRALVNGEHLQNVEAVIRVPSSGRTHWISANAAPILDAEGEIISAIVLFHDISEIKQAQIHLEKVVEERTASLKIANKDLKRQKEQLERSLKDLKEAQSQLVRSEKLASLGILVAGVGHEINNPLNFVQGGVLGIAQYIKDHESQNAQLNDILPFVESIEEGVTRASRIVKSLSRVSRQNKEQNEKCKIHEILENCLVMLHNKYKNRISVNRFYAEEDIMVMGNEGKLHQVFMNILSNAEQAIPEEGIVDIKTFVQDHTVCVQIADSGTGISKENLQKIGNPFFTTKEPGIGVGLGLYIVHTLLEEQRGEWHVESEEGTGTIFTIKLPLPMRYFDN